MSSSANTAWSGQPNGQITLGKMAVVGGQHFEPHFAIQIVAIQTAYLRAVGRSLPIVEGYRRLGARSDPPGTLSQWGMWNRKQQDPSAPVAAVPGTSNHGFGLACDFGSDLDSWASAGQVWFRANEARFGVSTAQGAASGEPWHKVCVTWLDASSLASLGGGTIIQEEDLPLNAQDLAAIQAMITTALNSTTSAIRRDARVRLYQNSDTGDYFAIDWRAPIGQRVSFMHAGASQIAALFNPYQYMGDAIGNAIKLPTATCQTLIGIAMGTDTIFGTIPSWVPPIVKESQTQPVNQLPPKS